MRKTALATVAIVVVALWASPVASAYTAPQLQSPSNNASFVEGGVIDFAFGGSLQGDAAASDRSFFRVELAQSSDVSGLGQQAPWPTISNFVITESGKDDVDARKAEMGVPDAGTYKWRVCAWGVADANVSLDLAQLSCSSTRTVVTTAEASSSGETTGSVTVQRDHSVVLATRHEQRVRDNSSNSNTSSTGTNVQRVTLPRKTPVFDTPLAEPTFGNGSNSSVHLGGAGLDVGGDGSSGQGALGAAQSALGATLPFIPIPYWSLLLFMLAMPLTHWWRKDLLGMFVFVDEHGTPIPDDEDETPVAE